MFFSLFSVSSHEETKNGYSIALGAFRNGLKILLNFHYIPTYVVSDGTQAIFSAVKDVFAETVTHLMCFKHLKDRVTKNYANKQVPKDKRKEITASIEFMQRIIDEDHLDAYWSKFNKKHPSLKNFTTYFEKTYMEGD